MTAPTDPIAPISPTPPSPPSPRETPDELSLRAHRLIIGALGFVLPWALYLLAGERPIDALPRRWERLDSISAYAYSGAGPLFAGVIFALALFLFAYRGYKDVFADRVVGAVGGGAAILVALCPTDAPAASLKPHWWTETIGHVHLGAAVVLFASFIVFSVWLFPMSNVPWRDQDWDKRIRNVCFYACGIVMAVAVLGALRARSAGAPIFVFEAVAVEAFALSWLVKGEAHAPLVALVAALFSRRAGAR